MFNYLAITIGPIYNTMILAKKTRELWSVSFTFSLLMKHLSEAFSKHGKLISPATGVSFPLHGAGIYPDKCFIKLNGNRLTEQEISDSKKTAFNNFHNETNLSNTETYYQVYIVQASFSANPIGSLNKMIDVLELQQKYAARPAINWKKEWGKPNYFQKLYKIGFQSNDELLPELWLQGDRKIQRFPSVSEISTNELAKKDYTKYWSAIGYQGIKIRDNNISFTRHLNLTEEVDDDGLILQRIKQAFPNEFLQRHKYFSVVQADGDNVGKLIAAIESAGGDIHELSKQLNSFAAEAAELLARYGAFPVYIGGDDLLFFAPVAHNTQDDNYGFSVKTAHGSVFGNNLFFLLTKLNEVFQEKVEISREYKINISLSFGVMCGYYKQPLREIKEAADEALLFDAKKQPGKNYISLKVQKHSGQSFSLGFRQNGQLYEDFLQLSYSVSKNIKDSFLNSVMYKLDDQKAVLARIGDDKIRLEIFFKENFNESYSSYETFFKAMIKLVAGVFMEFSSKNLEEKIKMIYGALRFVHFINAKDVAE
jgi:CRISPR-associated protein Cmr2